MNSTAETQIFTKPIADKLEVTSDLNGLQPFLEALDNLITKAISNIQSQKQSETELQSSNFQPTEISPQQQYLSQNERVKREGIL